MKTFKTPSGLVKYINKSNDFRLKKSLLLYEFKYQIIDLKSGIPVAKGGTLSLLLEDWNYEVSLNHY